MAEKTQHFGLNKFGTSGNITDDGNKFPWKDREILDALLWTLFQHDHSTLSVISNPAAGLEAALGTSGVIPAGADRYYRFSYLDTFGNETAASLETWARTPDPLPVAQLPSTVLNGTGGTLGVGTWRYAVGFYQTGTNRRTPAPNEAVVPITSGSTNSVDITLPYLPAMADGWDIWRKGPGESSFVLVTQVARGSNEEQEVYNGATSGSFTLTFDGYTTAALDYDASAPEVEAALEDLANIEEVTVTGVGTSGDPWVVTFVGPGGNVPALTADDSDLVGGTTTVTTTVAGTDLLYTDDNSVITTTVRPIVNTTNTSNSVDLSLPASELPLSDDIAAWRIYRTSRSGVYEAASLLATVNERDGGDLVTDYTDQGLGLGQGVPLIQSAVPPAWATLVEYVRSSAAVSATTLGSVTHSIEVFDADGNSLGYMPVYDSIT